jgi:hypothetical protein
MHWAQFSSCLCMSMKTCRRFDCAVVAGGRCATKQGRQDETEMTCRVRETLSTPLAGKHVTRRPFSAEVVY